MKSMEMEDHGYLGRGSDLRSPYSRCRGFFDLEHISQDSTNSLMSFHILGHQKSLEKFQGFIEFKMSNRREMMACLKSE